MSNLKKIRVDWFRVLADLERCGWSLSLVSTQIDVPRTTMQHWRSGGQAPLEEGFRLAQLWSSLVDQHQLPMRRDVNYDQFAEISASHITHNPQQQIRSAQ